MNQRGEFLRMNIKNINSNNNNKTTPFKELLCISAMLVFLLTFGGALAFDAAPTTKSQTDYKNCKAKLEQYLKTCSGKFGVYFVDLKTNQEFGINETQEYVAASTVKLPINMYLYSRIDAGKINPEGLMPYTSADYEPGTGSLQYTKYGTRYKVRTLASKSIIESDNVAINIIIRLVGRTNFKQYMRNLGGKVVYNNNNNSSPKDMAIYLKALYKSYSANKSSGKEIVKYMQSTIFNDRLPKLLPKNIKVAHKIGNQVATRNDVGIVFAKNPYIICVMSKNIKSESNADNVIANISKKVYDFMQSGK